MKYFHFISNSDYVGKLNNKMFFLTYFIALKSKLVFPLKCGLAVLTDVCDHLQPSEKDTLLRGATCHFHHGVGAEEVGSSLVAMFHNISADKPGKFRIWPFSPCLLHTPHLAQG